MVKRRAPVGFILLLSASTAITALALADLTAFNLITDTTDVTKTLPTDLTKLPRTRDPLKINLHPTY